MQIRFRYLLIDKNKKFVELFAVNESKKTCFLVIFLRSLFYYSVQTSDVHLNSF